MLRKTFPALLCLTVLLLSLTVTPASASRFTRTTCLPADQLPSAEVRLPGPVRMTPAEEEAIRAAGSLRAHPLLEDALSLLEEGNPFLLRYNLLTGSQVKPRMAFGVPYLFGGQAANHVFAKEPDYIVQAAWNNSPAYYRKGTMYLYGFDCVGFAKWLWNGHFQGAWPTVDVLLESRPRQLWNSAGKPMPAWEELPALLTPGDMLIYRHPGTHVVFYVGTLRQYGYTEAEVDPSLARWLDWPLVIHSGTNAGVARRFAWLIENGLSKYRVAADTDGGVAVSLLGVDPAQAPYHIHQQNQDTAYFTLPDGTWLTVVPWKNIDRYAWFPLGSELAPDRPVRREELFVLPLAEGLATLVESPRGAVRLGSCSGRVESADFTGEILPGAQLARVGDTASLRCCLQGTDSRGNPCLLYLDWTGDALTLRTDSPALRHLEQASLGAQLSEAEDGGSAVLQVFRLVQE